MLVYTLKRLALIIPTLFGILLVNFLIVQAAPGGPVDQMVAQLQGLNIDSTASFGGAGTGENIQVSNNNSNRYGISQDVIDKIEKMYGFDKPPSERFWQMVKSYAQFDFGESFFRSETVIELIRQRLPVSISLGLWSTLLIYLISIPLGIKKAVSHGSRFDITTSTIVTIAYAIPGFLFAIMLIVLFAGGSYWKIFPLRGLYSEHFDQMLWYQQIGDYLWHIFLPVLCYSISGFAQLTLLTKNSFLEEIHKQYALTAKAKGLNEKQVLYGHLFRNSMLVIIAGFPAAFAAMFFTGSMLIEYIFSLEGIGLLGFESVIRRDYPIVFGTLFIFSLINLLLKIISDLMYVLIDPRINFESHHAV